jgi:hypothetical protein
MRRFYGSAGPRGCPLGSALQYAQGTCDAGSPAFSDLARFHPDCCICLNALEHIEDDRQALHGMASILSAGGVVVLLVPAFPMLYGPIDSNLGHYRRYSRGFFGPLLSRLEGLACAPFGQSLFLVLEKP